MKERPILFSGEMVRAILEGRKTQTRRVVKPQPEWLPEVKKVEACSGFFWPIGSMGQQCGLPLFKNPYGQPGDRLWVRETWAPFYLDGTGMCKYIDPEEANAARYRATPEIIVAYPRNTAIGWRELVNRYMENRWHPSIHMPRWASRITLEITGVRVERLQDISEGDARAEGITDGGCTNCGEHEPCGCANPSPDARDAFCWLWGQINGDGSWHANPWVWVIEFERVKP
jgi:hypothetical protein